MLSRRQLTQCLLVAGATAVAGGCEPHAGPEDETGARERLDQETLYLFVFDVMRGLITDIGVGAGGHVWAIGADPEPGGYGIWRWRVNNWEKVPGGAVRIAVDPSGAAWLVNDAGRIFSQDGDTWRLLPGLARDIAVGANFDVFVVGHDRGPDGFGIHKWDGRQWNWIGTNAVRIAVGAGGDPWVINDKNVLFHQLRDGKWEQLPTPAIDVGVGRDDRPWIIWAERSGAGSGPILRWSGARRGPNNVFSGTGFFEGGLGSGTNVSAGNDRVVWAVDPQMRPLRKS